MIPPPTPWGSYQPGLFRLSGFGGAAVFLRTGVLSGRQPTLVLDIGFLTPTDYVWHLHQPMTAGFSEKLADFFFRSASDLSPQLSVSSVHDPLSGLDLQVLSSTDDQVELEIQVDEDGVNFLTTRVALTQAADAVRVLEAAVGIYEMPEPPMDW